MICGVFLLLIGVGGFVFFLFHRNEIEKIQNSYEQKILELQTVNTAKQHFVYVAAHTLQAGDNIGLEDVRCEMVYTSMPEELFANLDGTEWTARIDIPEGMQICTAMVTDEKPENNVREEEFGMIYLSDNLAENDMVDVRILYPNGENYIVLSKKRIEELHPENAVCYLWLDEQEILRMSSAILDAYEIPGSCLYTTKYVEETLQEASSITYIPRKETMELIKKSPNILNEAKILLTKKVREDLEKRVCNLEKQDLPQFLYSGVTGKTENITQEVSEEEEEIIYVD